MRVTTRSLSTRSPPPVLPSTWCRSSTPVRAAMRKRGGMRPGGQGVAVDRIGDLFGGDEGLEDVRRDLALLGEAGREIGFQIARSIRYEEIVRIAVDRPAPEQDFGRVSGPD